MLAICWEHGCPNDIHMLTKFEDRSTAYDVLRPVAEAFRESFFRNQTHANDFELAHPSEIFRIILQRVQLAIRSTIPGDRFLPPRCHSRQFQRNRHMAAQQDTSRRRGSRLVDYVWAPSMHLPILFLSSLQAPLTFSFLSVCEHPPVFRLRRYPEFVIMHAAEQWDCQ
jgi:hypothetical protein